MNILHIGGPLDGYRRPLPKSAGLHFQTAILGPPADPFFAPLSVGVTTHSYTLKQVLLQDGTNLSVAVHSTVTDVVKQLVKGYRGHRNPRRPFVTANWSRI